MNPITFDPSQMDSETIERGYAVNSLLMALHYGDHESFRQILIDNGDKSADYVMGTVATLKSMVDTLLGEMNKASQMEPDDYVTFPDLVNAMASLLMEVESGK